MMMTRPAVLLALVRFRRFVWRWWRYRRLVTLGLGLCLTVMGQVPALPTAQSDQILLIQDQRLGNLGSSTQEVLV